MADGNISSIQLPDGGIYNVKDNTSGFITGMTILSYGTSTWNDFITAYNANKVVYCRASSNSNPASGSQTRLAFMAYVNNASSPTEVEFQYYRSVNSLSDSQQGDQVFVYKITSAGTWTVTTRNAFTKIVAGGDLSSSYASGTLTISADIPTVPTNVSAFTNDAGYLTSYTETDPVFSASAAGGITSTDISNWNSKTSNTGTITEVKTAAGAHMTIDTTSGKAEFNVPTKTSHLTNDSSFTAKSTTTATLTTTWSSKTQTVSVTGVTASNTVVVTPAPASYNAYCEYGVYCSAQASGTLTFTCDEVPTSSLTVNVLILN